MALELFTLLAKLGLDKSEFSSGIKEATAEAEGFGSAFDAASQTDGFMNFLGVINKVVDRLGKALDNLTDYTDEVDKNSKMLDMSTASYQEWRYAMSQSGTSVENFRRGIANLNKAINGNGSKQLWAALEDLGFDSETLESFDSGGERIESIIYALSEIEDYSRRNSIADAIFGAGAGLDMEKFLQQGKEGIDDLRKEAEDIGYVMSDEDIQAAVEYKDATEKLNATLVSLEQELVVELAPALTEIVTAINNVIVWFRNLFGGDKGRTISGMQAKELSVSSKMGVDQFNQSLENVMKSVGYTAEEIKAVQNAMSILNYSPEAMHTLILDLQDAGRAAETLETAMNLAGKATRTITEDQARNLGDLYKIRDMKSFGEQFEATMKEAGYSTEEIAAFLQLIDDLDYDPVAMAALLADLTDAKSASDDLKIAMANMSGDYTATLHIGVDDPYGVLEMPQSGPMRRKKNVTGTASGEQMGTYAKGAWDIPFDNYPALLHRDEMVLNATRARQYREGSGSGQIDLNALISAVTTAVREGMNGVHVNSYLNGRDITDEVSRNIADDMRAMRFTPA